MLPDLESHGSLLPAHCPLIIAKHIMACQNKGKVSKSFSRFVI